MLIRPAAAVDAGAVTALWTDTYADAGPEGRREPYAEAEFFAAAATGEMTVVLEDDGTLVAVVVLNPPGAPERTVGRGAEAELSRLAVTPAARRRGIGRRLVEAAGARARELGAPAIVLWSRPYQTEAHRLYESIGYRRVPARDGRDGDGARLVFAMKLDGEID